MEFFIGSLIGFGVLGFFIGAFCATVINMFKGLNYEE